jgi:hypothetical protein
VRCSCGAHVGLICDVWSSYDSSVINTPLRTDRGNHGASVRSSSVADEHCGAHQLHSSLLRLYWLRKYCTPMTPLPGVATQLSDAAAKSRANYNAIVKPTAQAVSFREHCQRRLQPQRFRSADTCRWLRASLICCEQVNQALNKKVTQLEQGLENVAYNRDMQRYAQGSSHQIYILYWLHWHC